MYYALFAERIFLLLSHKTLYLILLSFQYSTIVPALFSINRLYTLFLLHVSFSPTTLPTKVHYNVLLYNLQVHYWLCDIKYFSYKYFFLREIPPPFLSNYLFVGSIVLYNIHEICNFSGTCMFAPQFTYKSKLR